MIECRRFEHGKGIDIEFVLSNLQQIWAQALYLYRSEVNHWTLTKEQEKSHAEMNKKFMAMFGSSAWICEAVDDEEAPFDKAYVSKRDIQEFAKENRLKSPTEAEINRAFTKLGWIRNTAVDSTGKTSAWKFKLRKQDLTRGSDTIRLFGKYRKVGDVVKMPEGWMCPDRCPNANVGGSVELTLGVFGEAPDDVSSVARELSLGHKEWMPDLS